MASKYKEIAKTMTTFALEDSYQQELDGLKAKMPVVLPEVHPPSVQRTISIKRMKVQDLAKLYVERKELKESLEDAVKSINKQLEAVNQVMVAQYEENDTESMKFDGLGTFFTKLTPYPQVKDRQKLNAWLKANGMEDMLTVNYKSLEGMVNEMLLNGEVLPDGVEAFIKTSIQRRK